MKTGRIVYDAKIGELYSPLSTQILFPPGAG